MNGAARQVQESDSSSDHDSCSTIQCKTKVPQNFFSVRLRQTYSWIRQVLNIPPSPTPTKKPLRSSLFYLNTLKIEFKLAMKSSLLSSIEVVQLNWTEMQLWQNKQKTLTASNGFLSSWISLKKGWRRSSFGKKTLDKFLARYFFQAGALKETFFYQKTKF